MAPPRKRQLWTIAIASALVVGVAIAFKVAGPLVRSTAGFVAVRAEPRVRYEPGAEKAAEAIARALPDAIRAVEAVHGRAFAKPVTIFVCATERSFERYGLGVRGAGGFVMNGRLFISPKPANTLERLPRLVTHELSHLHLEQATGAWWSTRHLPVWFKEGLAVHVATGGGAESVSEAEARAAIRAQRTFRRDTRGGVIFRQTASRDGLPAHLFYRESAMFVAFLARRSPAGFERLMQAIQERTEFAAAVRESFGRDIDALWEEFAGEVRGTTE